MASLVTLATKQLAQTSATTEDSEASPVTTQTTTQASSLTPMIAQAEHLTTAKLYTYGIISLDSSESSYLVNEGLQSLIAIIKAYEHDTLYSYIDEPNSPLSLPFVFLLEQLGQYLIWYCDSYGSFLNLVSTFTKYEFENFDLKSHNISTRVVLNTISSVAKPNNSSLKV